MHAIRDIFNVDAVHFAKPRTAEVKGRGHVDRGICGVQEEGILQRREMPGTASPELAKGGF
ncbi:MAG: hypothetical protein QMC89_02360 [Candidatus Hodarchaeaceae archaeon]|nr:hypothetical protein [Candidatus Hodarchaeaceae archaeon]